MEDDERTLERLAEVDLFSVCSRDELVEVAVLSTCRRFDRGQELCREGHEGTSCLVVLSGEAVLRSAGRPLAVIGPGDTVGEMALIERVPAMGTVTATAETECIEISAADFDALLDRSPRLARALLVALSRRLRSAQEARSAWR